MKNTNEDKKGKNFVKVGSFEEFLDSANTDKNELSENRDRFKKIIEPWLSAALQTDHLSMLVGAGLTTAVCQIASVSSSSILWWQQ